MSVSEALGKIALKATLFMRILEIFTKRNRFSSERDMKYMTRIFANMDEFAPPYLCVCSPVIPPADCDSVDIEAIYPVL